MLKKEDRLLLVLLILSLMLAGVLLIITLGVVPSWLYYSLFTGTLLYTLATLGVWRRYRIAYFMVGALALVILFVSLRSPAHYEFIRSGLLLQASIFISGTILQILILSILITRVARSILQHRLPSQRQKRPP